MLLALDSSTPALALGLADGDRILAARSVAVEGRLEDGLLPAIEALLLEAGVARTAIRTLAVGLGPGGYTSLRVGIATVKGLAVGLKAQLVGVGTLRVLARGAVAGDGDAVVLTDARRGEVYGTAYRFIGATSVELVAPVHGSMREVVAHVTGGVGDDGVVAVGDAFGVYPELAAMLGERARVVDASLAVPQPEALLREVWAATARGDVATLEGLEPHYVKPSDAKLPVKPLRTSLGGEG